MFGPQLARAAAVTEVWVHRYSNVVSNSNDQAVKVVRDAADDIIVTGTTYVGGSASDMLTIKYSGADGSVLWQNRYHGATNGFNGARSLAVDGSGNVVVTGVSDATFHGNSYPLERGDYYTAKYAGEDGALLWEQRYNGPANGGDEALALAVDGSGNVVVTGYSWSGANSNDYYTAKYAAVDGALIWEKRYNGPGNGQDAANAVALDTKGNVVVTGYSRTGSNTDDYYTAKYAAADGALLWEKRYNGPVNGDDAANAVAVDGSGNVVVTGSSWGDGSRDYYTAKYAAANGTLLWERRSNGPANSYDEALAVALDPGGNVVVTGVSRNSSLGDYYTAKYAAASGTLLWEQRYNGPGNSSDSAVAVAVDASGNVAVTGYSVGSGLRLGYYTAKYAALDGTLLWAQRYDQTGINSAIAYALTVDSSGNVMVTGFSSGDYYTAKYAAANGTPLWEARYNGPANSPDSAIAVAVDVNGNVVVTGLSYNGSGYDYYTAKYAVVDGALLWAQRSVNGDNQPSAIDVDRTGDVLVTGSSYNGTNFDCYTAK